MVPEDELDACPWASGLDLSGDHIIMAIQPEKSEKVMPQLLTLAEQLELVCFDPQASKVYLPQRLRAEPVATAAGAACASRSQPTPTLLNGERESGGGEGPQGNTVFISWSNERSRLVAEALRGWLPFVLQTVNPWMSVTDEEKGSQWESEISARLDESPWLLFEAGALSKKLSESRVCTYLLDLTPAAVRPPMGMFHFNTRS